MELGRNSEAAEPFNQIQERAYKNKDHNLTSVSLDDIKVQWDHEFTYEQKSLLNSYRWKSLISDIKKVTTYEHYDDSYATAGKIGRDRHTVNPFFARSTSISWRNGLMSEARTTVSLYHWDLRTKTSA